MTTEQLQSNFYTIAVQFPNSDSGIYCGKLYTYKVPNAVKISVDDFAVVRVEGRAPELKIVRVVEVHEGNACDPNAPFKYKWVIQRVAIEGYEERLVNDRKLTELVAELKNRKARQSIIDDISTVASTDELNEIKRLSGLV